MPFDDLFREDRPKTLLQKIPSRVPPNPMGKYHMASDLKEENG
jgi:hypothetical protein